MPEPPFPPARPMYGAPQVQLPYPPAPGHGGLPPLSRAQQVFIAFSQDGALALSPLQEKALMWLDLSEASGTRFDSTSFNHDFTEVGSVPVVAGLQSMNALDLPATGGGADILTLPAQPSVLVADASWSGSVWLWSDVAGPKVAIGHVAATLGSLQKWRILFNVGNITFGQLNTVGPTYKNVSAAFSTLAFHHVYFQYDKPGDLVGLSLDNAALVTTAFVAGSPQLADEPMALGDQIAAGFLPWNGRMQFFGLFDQLLSVAERNTLYNTGLGASWAML